MASLVFTQEIIRLINFMFKSIEISRKHLIALLIYLGENCDS